MKRPLEDTNDDAGNGDAGNGDASNGDAGNGDADNGDADNGDAGNGDNHKSLINGMSEHLICPITQELPVHPVIAADGCCYEKSAIEKWLKNSCKSPVTNQTMATKLYSSSQIRNVIKSMVESNALTGAKADAWMQRIRDEREVLEVQRRMCSGEAEAANILGSWYMLGKRGLSVNQALAFSLYKKAADMDHADALCNVARCYSNGIGTTRDELRGMMSLTQSATLGSRRACYKLGLKWKLKHDNTEAKRWFTKMLSCETTPEMHTIDAVVTSWLDRL